MLSFYGQLLKQLNVASLSGPTVFLQRYSLLLLSTLGKIDEIAHDIGVIVTVNAMHSFRSHNVNIVGFLVQDRDAVSRFAIERDLRLRYDLLTTRFTTYDRRLLARRDNGDVRWCSLVNV